MEEALILLRQLITMFLYVGVGWCLRRFRLVTQENSSALSNLLLYAILPCVIVQSFLREATSQATQNLLWSLLLSALALGVSAAVSALLFWKKPASNFAAPSPTRGLWGFP